MNDQDHSKEYSEALLFPLTKAGPVAEGGKKGLSRGRGGIKSKVKGPSSKHPLRYRNRRIGEFLKELDLTEGRSTGISKIIKAMAANGSPAPEFETDENRTYFLVRLPVHTKAAVAMAEEAEGVSTAQKTTQKNQSTTQKIVEVLKSNLQASRRLIAENIGDITEDGVKYHLDKLKTAGKIKRIGPDKGGHWEVIDE